MLTNVHLAQTLATAVLPLVLTRWAATRVPVMQDTPEMDLLVQVCKLNLVMATLKQQLHK